MGQLLARRGHQGRKPAGRPPLDRDLRGAGGARRIRRCRPRSNSPTARSASRSSSARTISRCRCWKASCRATEIKLGRVPNGSPYRFNLLMRGDIEATTLTEPYISLAEKKGCRLVVSAFHHGTEVASDRVDAETYGAFNRAVREAVRRINANKRAYLHYFIDYYKAQGSRDRQAHDRRSARKPHLCRRSRADPRRRVEADLRLDEELGVPRRRLRRGGPHQRERAGRGIRAGGAGSGGDFVSGVVRRCFRSTRTRRRAHAHDRSAASRWPCTRI